MRQQRMAAILAIAFGLWGCGEATVTTGSLDSGQSPTRSWNPQPKPIADAGTIPPPLPASLSGQVTLLGSASNAGASVTITEGETTEQTVTDANGSYFADDLAAGDLTVTFGAPGYQSQTRSATVAAGDSVQISVSLEHSRLLQAFAEPPTAGATLGYAQWIVLSDGGQGPGTHLYYFDASRLISLDADAGARELLTDDGGLRFLGFDREGGAVVDRITVSGTEVTFALDFDGFESNAPSPLELGSDVGEPSLIGDEVFFAHAHGTGKGNENDWSAITRGDLGPTPIAASISALMTTVALGDEMAGWEIGTGGYSTPVAFGPGFSVPIDAVCTKPTSPLTASLDGQRYAFALIPRSLPLIGVTPPPPDPDACTPSAVPLVFIDSAEKQQVTQIADATMAHAKAAVYPLTTTSYAGTGVNLDASLHLFVHQAKKSGAADAGIAWTSQWESDVAGWAPLHGPNLLAADQVDGGLALEAVGPAAVVGTLSVSASLPFAHEWSAPLAISADNRYVVLQGIAALFDLKNQAEIPLIVTPLSVQFDRLETTALLLDHSGQMAVLPLGGPAGVGPQGLRLEGSAVAASFTPNEDAVAYAGTDASGESGIFVEPIPAAQ